jgi:hypothetical protein
MTISEEMARADVAAMRERSRAEKELKRNVIRKDRWRGWHSSNPKKVRPLQEPSGTRIREEAPRVLLVEGEPAIMQVIEQILDLNGYHPHRACRTNAVEVARTFRPHVTVLGMVTPDRDTIRLGTELGESAIALKRRSIELRVGRCGSHDSRMHSIRIGQALGRLLASALPKDLVANSNTGDPTTELESAVVNVLSRINQPLKARAIAAILRSKTSKPLRKREINPTLYGLLSRGTVCLDSEFRWYLKERATPTPPF